MLGERSYVRYPRHCSECGKGYDIEVENITPEDFERMIKRAFDVLYRESEEWGRVVAISLHPFLIGLPHRIAALDKGLEYICSHKGVWRATGEEIVNHFLAQQGTT